jgi:transmembrane sensor
MGEHRQTGDDLTRQAVDWLVALDHGHADEKAFETWRAADPRHAAIFAQVAAIWRRTGTAE